MRDPLTINVIYCMPGQNNPGAVWRQPLFQRSNSMVKTIYVGDFNTQNTGWNCQHTDINGDRLTEEIDRARLYVINDDTLRHVREGGYHDSNLDLIIANETICNQID